MSWDRSRRARRRDIREMKGNIFLIILIVKCRQRLTVERTSAVPMQRTVATPPNGAATIQAASIWG